MLEETESDQRHRPLPNKTRLDCKELWSHLLHSLLLLHPLIFCVFAPHYTLPYLNQIDLFNISESLSFLPLSLRLFHALRLHSFSNSNMSNAEGGFSSEHGMSCARLQHPVDLTVSKFVSRPFLRQKSEPREKWIHSGKLCFLWKQKTDFFFLIEE